MKSINKQGDLKKYWPMKWLQNGKQTKDENNDRTDLLNISVKVEYRSIGWLMDIVQTLS